MEPSRIMHVKPPLGVLPRKIHDEYRLEDLSGAISRYIDAQLPVKPEWIEEYNELVKKKEENNGL